MDASRLINDHLSPDRNGNFGLSKAVVDSKREKEKGGEEKPTKHGIQEAFSHSASCITHEVLTESCTHSPFPLAVSCWQLAQARTDKLFRPFSLSDALFRSFRLPGIREGKGLHPTETRRCCSRAGATLLVSLVKAGCPRFCRSVFQRAPCLDSLTDLNLNAPRTRGRSLHAYITQPTSTSSSPLVCFDEVDLVRVSSSFPAWNLFPEFSLCFAPRVPLQLGSLSFSHVSLSVSLPSFYF